MSSEERKTTSIAELGEFGLIRKITEPFNIHNPSTVCGPGDDAAVLDYGGKRTLVTTDLLVEGIHFNRIYTPLKHLGYKSVAVNLSDICAMNAVPRQVFVSIAISGRMSVEEVEEIYSGIRMACERYKVDLAGGDTSSSLTGLMISITAIGEADEKDIVYRKGAKENDLICVSGDLGAAYLGLLILERERRVFESTPGVQPDLKGHDYILMRQLKPEPRTDVVQLLKEKGIMPTAMIDISDGLSSEILHICSQSGCGAKIYGDRIPIHADAIQQAKDFNMAPETAALNGGEDYELLFTVPLSDFEKVKDLPDISIIGNITGKDEGVKLVITGGHEVEIVAGGWEGWQTDQVRPE
jgi:thiamine-monophosphate kinase